MRVNFQLYCSYDSAQRRFAFRSLISVDISRRLQLNYIAVVPSGVFLGLNSLTYLFATRILGVDQIDKIRIFITTTSYFRDFGSNHLASLSPGFLSGLGAQVTNLYVTSGYLYDALVLLLHYDLCTASNTALYSCKSLKLHRATFAHASPPLQISAFHFNRRSTLQLIGYSRSSTCSS